jgi:hypothetical protein
VDFLEGFKLPMGKTWDWCEKKGDWHCFAVRL